MHWIKLMIVRQNFTDKSKLSLVPSLNDFFIERGDKRLSDFI